MSVAEFDAAGAIARAAAALGGRVNGADGPSLPAAEPLAFTWAADYPTVTAPETIVGGLLEAGTLAVLYGEANTGKSTFALDLALAITRGEPWRGRTTRKGIVLWLALESAAGLRRRVVAHRVYHDTARAALFADVTVAVSLLEVHDVASIIATIRAAESAAGEKCALLVVDTTARALAGGDENDGRDMGTLVRGCDLIRAETGAAVLLIHHSGKDSTRGARGHSSLRAAVDTELEVSGQANPRQARVTKQRDLPSGDVFAFDLEPVEIGQDPATAAPITACVVVHRNDVAAMGPRPKGKAQADILRALRNRQADADAPLIWTLEELRKIGRDLGQHRNTARDAVDGLALAGFLTATVGGHRLAEAAR